MKLQLETKDGLLLTIEPPFHNPIGERLKKLVEALEEYREWYGDVVRLAVDWKEESK